jgi:3-oxochol-4-en-24-oyl-CoA dehydrogenase
MTGMALALSDDHVSLAEVARSFLQHHNAQGAARSTLADDTTATAAGPGLSKAIAALGWIGLAVPEDLGGQGYGVLELCIVLEELGRVVAPVSVLSNAIAATLLAHYVGDTQAELVKSLVDGTRTAAVALNGSVQHSGDRLTGDVGPVLSAGSADVLLIAVGANIVIVNAGDAGVTVTPTPSLDTTMPYATVTLHNVAVDPHLIITAAASTTRRLAQVLTAATAVGVARACIEAAVDYAKVRVQFGRPIATFQAVKHHAANMLVHAELATAATWDAARIALASSPDDAAHADFAAAEATSLALRAAVFCAQKNIQIHGGIGFTWEHDAHLFLRRAQSLTAAYVAVAEADAAIATALNSGVERRFAMDLPPEAETYRAVARETVAALSALDAQAKRAYLVDSGYLVPHWPVPFGRAAGPVEQLVIEEEFADIDMPNLGITGWNILTITQHGTDDQLARWVKPALLGEEVWCQLFSEPEAGSDAAAIKTRGTRVEGGWKVTGQKVWTSGAQYCQRGFATVRTDFDCPKHQGVTMMVIDLTAPGVDIRPLRELTGESLFNEVFFDDVFVPDDDVVGPVGQGWTVARATLGNERVSIGAGARSTMSAVELHALARRIGALTESTAGSIARLVAQEDAMRLLNIRSAARAVAGGAPGPEGNITKLLSSDHAQQLTELSMEIVGVAAVASDNAEMVKATFDYLFARCLSIAGGTSEIARNLIAERLLGMPRDPLAK